MINRKKSTNYLVQSAVIAALYATLTYLSSVFGIAYGPVQFRVSEALTVLPIFSPAAVAGLTVGCFIGNLGSPYGIIDILCGTLATLIAGLMTRALRGIRFKNFPLLSILPPIIMNSVIIGLEIAFFMPKGFSWYGYLIAGVQVGLGEAVVCFALGIPLVIAIEKNKTIKAIFKQV